MVPVRPDRSLSLAPVASQTASRSSSVSNHDNGLDMIDVKYRVTPAGRTVWPFSGSVAARVVKLRGLIARMSRARRSSVPDGLV